MPFRPAVQGGCPLLPARRQTNLRPGAVDVKDALRHAYKAFDTPCFSRKLYKALLQCRKGHRGTDLQHRFLQGDIRHVQYLIHIHIRYDQGKPFRLEPSELRAADAGPPGWRAG